MQVVDGDAIPGRVFDQPTERIIERRKKAWRAPAAAPPVPEPAPEPAPARYTIIAISLITFMSGALVATAVGRFRHHTVVAEIGQPIAKADPAPQPATPVLERLMPAEPPAAAQPAPPPQAIDPIRERPPLLAKPIGKAPHVGPASSIRPRRPAPPQKATRAAGDDPLGPPAAKSTGPRQWVDPFE
jgi:hypothetical protein